MHKEFFFLNFLENDREDSEEGGHNHMFLESRLPIESEYM